MVTIKIDNDEYRLPSCWDDLTEKQLLHLAELTMRDEISSEQLKLHMALYCLGARVENDHRVFGRKLRLQLGMENEAVPMRIGRKRYALKPTEYVSLASVFDFLLSLQPKMRQGQPTGKYAYELKPRVSECMLKPFWVGFHRFVNLGGSCLMELSFDQYMYIQVYASGIASGVSTVEEVLACVWVSDGLLSDGRFRASDVIRDAARLKRLSPLKKMVMMWYVQNGLEELRCMFPRVFSGEGDDATNILDSQLRLLDRLAEHDTTRKNALRECNILDIFYSIDGLLEEQEKLEEMKKK